MDLQMPVMNGVACTRQLRLKHPDTKVLVLTTFDDDDHVFEALRAGAAGYLTKHSPPEKVIEAVHRLASGKKYITPETAESLAGVFDVNPDQAPHELLSDREFQTLRFIASGKTLSEVAETLCISPKTVSVYRARLLEKMKLKNNSELTHYAIKAGLID